MENEWFTKPKIEETHQEQPSASDSSSDVGTPVYDDLKNPNWPSSEDNQLTTLVPEDVYLNDAKDRAGSRLRRIGSWIGGCLRELCSSPGTMRTAGLIGSLAVMAADL